MKILYLHQYFKLPTESGGTRSYWIARELIKKGYQVVVITSKNNLTKGKEVKIVEGIKIIYLNVSYSNDMGVFRRLFSFFHFMISSCYYSLKEKDVDLCFATSTPLTIGFPALINKWFRGVPFVFEVRDLWPEVPIQMGALRNPIVIKLALFFEKLIYKNAARIIALSPGMAKGVRKVIENKKPVTIIPNMSKKDEFFPHRVDEKLKKALGLNQDKFRCIHFGAMGIANGLEYIIDAAIIAQNENFNELEFVFLGEGKEENRLKKIVLEHRLENVKFLGARPMWEVAKIVNICDVSVVSFSNIEILKTNSPNKLFDSLSAGKPIIVNSSGWTKDIVEKSRCGFYVSPNNPCELIEKLIELKGNTELYSTFSKNSRQLAETKYDKTILAPLVAQELNLAV